MSNRVLLISGNFYPEPTGIGKYSGEMVEWMSENGYSCTVITTFPYYPDWKIDPTYKKSRFWFKKEIRTLKTSASAPVKIIRCPHYIPGSPSGFKRLLSEFTISLSAYLALIPFLFQKKFDFILTISPPFELGLLGAFYKKIKGGKFIYHIQDLQIDAARELGMVKSTYALKVLTSIERYIISSADRVSTISDGMIRKLKKKTNRHINLFPNWVDTSKFFPITNKTDLKEKYGFTAYDKIVMYSGAIGVKQGLQSMIVSALAFRSDPNIKFVICGNGPYKEHLIRFKDESNAHNVVFLPLQAPDDLNLFLNMADVHLVIQKSKAGDLMMPSKLSTILAVGGLCIVTANPGTGLHEIINSAEMGFTIQPENQMELDAAIKVALSEKHLKQQQNARNFAQAHLSANIVLPKFLKELMVEKEKNISAKHDNEVSYSS